MLSPGAPGSGSENPTPTRLPRRLELTPAAYERICELALIAICFIIVTGAAVRLTGSGLGCTEWPTCKDGQIVAQLETHEMIEFGNRLITGVVSVAVILAVLGSMARRPRRQDLTLLSWGLVLGVMGQAVLGGISVKMELAPAFISAHFLLSVVLVWNAVVLHERAGQPEGPAVAVADRTTIWCSRLSLAMAVAVLVSGTLVTGTGPHAGDERASRYDFAALTDIARAHSVLAWVFLAVVIGVSWRLTRSGAPAQVLGRGRALLGAIVLQGAIGYAQYAAGVPPYLVILHVLGSVLVFVAALRFHLGLFTRASGSPDLTRRDPATTPVPVER